MDRTDPSAAPGMAAFDEYARQLHRQSLAQLPPAVHAGLRDARREALTQRRGTRMPRWLPAGLAATAVLAMVAMIGLQPLADDPPPEATLTQATVVGDPAPVALAATDPELALMLDSLDHTPDFYLWLAANDDALPATEY